MLQQSAKKRSGKKAKMSCTYEKNFFIKKLYLNGASRCKMLSIYTYSIICNYLLNTGYPFGYLSINCVRTNDSTLCPIRLLYGFHTLPEYVDKTS